MADITNKIKEELKDLIIFFSEFNMEIFIEGIYIYYNNNKIIAEGSLEDESDIDLSLPKLNNNETEIHLGFYEDSFIYSLKDVFALKKDFQNSTYKRNLIYKSLNKYILRVSTSNMIVDYYSSGEVEVKNIPPEDLTETTYTLNGKKYNISLIRKSLEQALSVIKARNIDEYHSPIFEDDLFINIYCEEGIVEENIDAVIQRYIFEMDSVFNIQVFESPRPSLYHDEEEIDFGTMKIIDREVNDSLSEVLSIFNLASSLDHLESKILNYNRVIEHVSQTVVKNDLLDAVHKRLASNKIYNPDAEYILSLQDLFKKYSENITDKQAIKKTIHRCCDVILLKEFVPPKLSKKFNKIDKNTKEDKIIEAFEDLGNCIVDTRNMIAHAKANYEKTGSECPKEEYEHLCNCLKEIARQVIRWYSNQSESYVIK